MLGNSLGENGLIEISVDSSFTLSPFSTLQDCYSYLGLEDISDDVRTQCVISSNKLVISQFKQLETGAIIGIVFKAINPASGTYNALEIATFEDAGKTKKVDATLSTYDLVI